MTISLLFKRLFDIISSGIGLIISIPFLVLVAIAIKFESPGPVFYRGERVGRKKKVFRIFKFRTMVQNADKIGGTSTSANDSRLTKVGKMIRSLKLDEFTQLINVFLVDMSIVGPRPQVKWAVDLYSGEERLVLDLRPGITDWASLYFNNEEEIIAASGIKDPDEAYMKLIHPAKVKMQLAYFHHHNLLIDLEIIFATLLTLIITRFGSKAIIIPKQIRKIAEKS
jgi:lipopolysaccharide/colanic/teichoic acid biosynthesis glycosyltransferase